MSSSESQQGVKAVFIGVCIGLIPSLVTTYLQARYQIKQTVYEHQIRSLTDLSQVVNGSAVEFLAQTYNLEDEVRMSDLADEKSRQAVRQKLREFHGRYLNLIGKANLNINLANLVFAANLDEVDLSGTAMAVVPPIESDGKAAGHADPSLEKQKVLSELAQARQAVFQKIVYGLGKRLKTLQSSTRP